MVKITKFKINEEYTEKENINKPRKKIVGVKCELYKKVAELKNLIVISDSKDTDYNCKTIVVDNINKDNIITSYHELEIYNILVYKNANEELLLNFNARYKYEDYMCSKNKPIEERHLSMKTMKEICEAKEFLDMADFIIKDIEEQINKMKQLNML